MSSAIRWACSPAALPLDGRPKHLGVVHAPDRAAALEAGRLTFGIPVVVRSMASREAEQPAPIRRPRASGARSYPKSTQGRRRQAELPLTETTEETPDA